MAASMRRLITHSRNRSDDVSDSDTTLSPSLSSSPSRRLKSPTQRSHMAFPVLGKVGSADTGSPRRTKPLQISSPQLLDLAAGEAASVMSGAVARSATVHSHKRNVSDTSGWSSLPLRQQKSGSRKQQRKPPALMHQRPLKSLNPLTRSRSASQRLASLRQGPPRPPRPDEVPQPPFSRRPSLQSVSSDSFIETRNSRRVSLASSDPGSIFLDRSKDDLHSDNEHNIFSEELRNFILEADRAFQLGGDPSLSLPRQRHPIVKPDPPSRTGSTTPQAVTPRPSIPRKSVGSGTSVKRKSSTSRPIKPSAAVPCRTSSKNQNTARDDTSVVRRSSGTRRSGSKTIQKKSQPSITMPRKKVSWEARLEAKGSKWGLSEGMTEILTGQRFKKIEADEMLTPERMEELRAQREKERIAEAKEEQEAINFDHNSSWIDIGLDTSEEECSPCLSPSRSKSASPDIDESFPPTPPPKDDQSMADDLCEEIPIVFRGSAYGEVLPPPPKRTGVFDPVHDALPPTPPPKSARRKLNASSTEANNNKYKDSHGSSIETLTLPSPALCSSSSSVYTDASFSPGPATPILSELQRKLSASEDEDNIYLRSTLYSFAHPMFQHGAITFAKAEVGKGAVKMDDTLDWTAFQMAILGGAGDMEDVVDEWEDARLSEDLVKWFDGHGFEDWGRMVMEEEAMREPEVVSIPAPTPESNTTSKPQPPSISDSPASSSTSSLDSFDSKGDRLGTGSGATPPPLNIRRKQRALPTLTAQCLPSNDGSLGSTRASVIQSKSPARGPAVVGGGGPGDVDEDEAYAPMGFNLSSDLGEYLQWEAEYAYATDL